MKITSLDNRPSFALRRAKSLRASKPLQGGFTLIELMIALVLGLLIIAGAISLLLSNKQTYVANTALGEVQDNARAAFELMARDIREAGLTGCGNSGRVANVLYDGPVAGGTDWYADIANAIVGFDGTTADPAVQFSASSTPGQRVSGANSSSIELVGSDGVGVTIAADTPSTASMTINESSTAIQAGDLAVVCDPDHAAIMQVSNYAAGPPIALSHNATSSTPGNCSVGLGFPTSCTSPGNTYVYAANSQLAKLYAADWYVGYNNVGGTSLYRMTLVNTGGVPTPTAQEMVRNVTGMQILYNSPTGANPTSFVSATSVGAGNWGLVAAVQITFYLQSSSKFSSSSAAPITRQMTTTVALRNRL